MGGNLVDLGKILLEGSMQEISKGKLWFTQLAKQFNSSFFAFETDVFIA